jgi:hypothetical protein
MRQTILVAKGKRELYFIFSRERLPRIMKKKPLWLIH